MIAEKLGYSGRSGAYKAVQRALRDIPYEAAQEVRQLQILRWETMLKHYWFTAIDPSHPDQVKAGRAVLQILDGINEAAGLKVPPLKESRRAPPQGGTIIDIR